MWQLWQVPSPGAPVFPLFGFPELAKNSTVAASIRNSWKTMGGLRFISIHVKSDGATGILIYCNYNNCDYRNQNRNANWQIAEKMKRGNWQNIVGIRPVNRAYHSIDILKNRRGMARDWSTKIEVQGGMICSRGRMFME